MATPTSIGSRVQGLGGGGASNPVSITCSAAVAIGQKVWLAVSDFAPGGAAAPATVSDSKSNTWNTVATRVYNDGAVDAVWLRLYYSDITVALTTSDTITANWSFPNTSAICMCAAQCAGMLAGAADKSASASGTGASYSSGATAATTQAAEIVIGAAGSYRQPNSMTATPGSGYTELFDLNLQETSTAYYTGLHFIWKETAATGAQTGSGTWSDTADGWASIVAAFKETVSVFPSGQIVRGVAAAQRAANW